MSTNFDCMTKEELRDWICTTDMQIQYAWNKIHAINCREKGNISDALYYETKCESIYKNLPRALAW